MSSAEAEGRSVEPPQGVSPGVLGTIVLGRAGYEQITATMLDLASRGHLKLPVWTSSGGSWRPLVAVTSYVTMSRC